MWRVDHLRTGCAIPETPIWRDSKWAADLAAWRLTTAGYKHVIVWFDAAVYA